MLELCSGLLSSKKPFWAERDWARLGMDCPSHSFEGITLILPFRMVKDWEQQWLKPADCQSYKRHRKAVVEALIHRPESIGHACCPWISDILFHTKKKTISSKCLCFHQKNNQNEHLITKWRRKTHWLFESWYFLPRGGKVSVSGRSPTLSLEKKLVI